MRVPRKTLSLLVIMALMIALVAPMGLAEDIGDEYVGGGDGGGGALPEIFIDCPNYVNKGDTFTINVFLSNVCDLYGAAFELAFDPGLINIDSVSSDLFDPGLNFVEFYMPVPDLTDPPTDPYTYNGSFEDVKAQVNSSGLFSFATLLLGETNGINLDATGKAIVSLQCHALNAGTVNLFVTGDSANVTDIGFNLTKTTRIQLSNSSAQAIAYTTADRSITIEETGPSALTVTTSSLPDATVGQSYNATLAASGGTPPYTWSLADGSLPAGITLSTDGLLSGTPTESGQFNFTVEVQDNESNVAAKSLTLNVNDDTTVEGPTVSVGSATGTPGTTVEVPITIDDPAGMAGFQFTITYDPTVAVVTNIAAGDAISGPVVQNLNDAASGTAMVTYAGAQAIEAGGILCNLTFTIKNIQAPISTDIDLSGIDGTMLTDESGMDISASTVKGKIDVISLEPTITVQVGSGFDGLTNYDFDGNIGYKTKQSTFPIQAQVDLAAGTTLVGVRAASSPDADWPTKDTFSNWGTELSLDGNYYVGNVPLPANPEGLPEIVVAAVAEKDGEQYLGFAQGAPLFVYRDTAAPTGSVTINDGAPTAYSLDVQLNISCTDEDLATVEVSNDGTNWVRKNTGNINWTLAEGSDGQRTVYVKLTDDIGNSTIVSDTISFELNSQDSLYLGDLWDLVQKVARLSQDQANTALILAERALGETKDDSILSTEEWQYIENIGTATLTHEELKTILNVFKTQLVANWGDFQTAVQEDNLVWLLDFAYQVRDEIPADCRQALIDKGITKGKLVEIVLNVTSYTFDNITNLTTLRTSLGTILEQGGVFDVVDRETLANHGINYENLNAFISGLSVEEKQTLKVMLEILGVIELSNNADLATLTADVGTLVPGFDPAVNSYTLTLAADYAGNVPVISATAADAKANVQINQASGIGKNATVVVTAEDGTQKTYTITVKKRTKITDVVGEIKTDGTATNIGFTADTSNIEIGDAIADEDIENVNLAIDVPKEVESASITAKAEEQPSGEIQAEVPAINVTAIRDIGGTDAEVKIAIPAGTKVSAPAGSNWDGTIILPTVKQAPSVDEDQLTNNRVKSVDAVIEIGFGDVPLTFDKPVRLLLPGQAGKEAAYVRSGVLTKITRTISADTVDAADAEIPEGGDGKVTVGSDLAIWTKHFTEFIAYTPEPSGGGGGGGGAVTPKNEVTKDISPNKTTTVTATDDKAQITVPAGAVSTNAEITVTVIDEKDQVAPTAGMIKIGNLQYRIEVKDDQGNAIRQFAKDLELEFNYDDEDLPQGTNENALKVVYYDEAREAWIVVPTRVDNVANKVTAKVNHLTVFAVMAMPEFPSMEDVQEHWAEADILKVASLNIICGDPDGNFRPEDNITREGFAKLAVLAAGLEPVQYPVLTFADADEVSDWAKGYVAAAANAGLITGYEDNTFRGKQLITRAEIATLIVRTLGAEATENPQLTFADAADVPEWARGYVAKAVEEGIIEGYPDGTFRANANATRAHAAVMIARMLK